jgi:proline iminopeptidase
MSVGDIAINGTMLWYTEAGAPDGPVCLVLHGGLGIDTTLYRETFTALEDRVRLLYVDQRGNGRSARPPAETITIEQLADDAAALVRELGHERVAVLGHSYGGFVAQELALRHPEVVDRLVLVDTTPGQLGANEDPDVDQGPPPPPELQAAMANFPSSNEEMRAGIADFFRWYLHRRDVNDVLPALEATIFDTATMVQGFVALSTWSAVDRLHTIDVPTLVVGGRHDLFTSWPQSRRIADRIPRAELVIFEESGHMPWLDEPDAFFTLVAPWLTAGRAPLPAP